MADDSGGFDLVASFFTLTGAGFGEEPRYSFIERCRAAAAAGFTGIGLHADDLPRTVASGLDVPGMQAVLADTGLHVVEIEFLGGWALATDPAELDRTVRRIEAVADAFGGRHVSAGEFRGGVPLDLGAAGRRLEELARRLAGRGLQVAVEAFPWSVLAGPAAVPELLRQVQAPNLGQMVDVWHFFNNGGTPDALTGPIAAVQLNDGPRVHGDYLVHARAARRLPGEGELDVAGLLRAVLATASPARGASRSTHRSSVHSRSARPLGGQQRQRPRRSRLPEHRGHGPDPFVDIGVSCRLRSPCRVPHPF